MKALVTGANGFVGSRVVVELLRAGLDTAILLRPSSSRVLLEPCLSQVQVFTGSVEDPASLDAALAGITHVIHCAGKTKALRVEEFEAVNVRGTRHLVEAMNRRLPAIERLIHISSLAAIGPSDATNPGRETDSPHPVSAYGRSKLRSEAIVRETCRVPFVILRPPGVYGPGDRDFLQLFRALRWRLLPLFGRGRQPLSLVYVDDLAAVVAKVLTVALGPRREFSVAHAEVVSAAELSREAARQLGVRAIPLPLPVSLLTPLAAAGELAARLRGRPAILSLDRRRELQAPGWVCDVTRLKEELGLECPTCLSEGIARALEWYRRFGWI